MNIALIVIMKNEADVIELFVRHHLPLFSTIYVVDHNSTDASRTIAEQIRDEGEPVVVSTYHDIGHNQDRITNQLAMQIAKSSNVDWIISLDADEFLDVSEKTQIEDCLKNVPANMPALVKLKTYLPTLHDVSNEKNLLVRICHHLETEWEQYTKTFVPAGILRGGKYQFCMGGNYIVETKNRYKILKSVEVRGISIAHFPVRSEKQIMAKVLSGWLNTLCKATYRNEEAYHWHSLYQKFMYCRRITEDELAQIGFVYYCKHDCRQNAPGMNYKPVVYNGQGINHISSLTYEVDPIVSALITAETIARELGRLRSRQVRERLRMFFKEYELSLKRLVYNVINFRQGRKNE